jgi:regulator of sigma E protease
VHDADGQLRTRTLNLQGIEGLGEEDDPFVRLGLKLWRPHVPAIIGQIKTGGAAERAGFQAGDHILSVDGEAITDWQEWASYVRQHPAQRLSVDIDRDGQKLTLAVTPEAVKTDQGTIGLINAYGKVPDDFAETIQVTTRYGPLKSISASVAKTWDMSLFTLRMLGRMLVGRASLANISGPITIAQFAGQSASFGFVPFLAFLALVSISLGVLNLLPVPVLDGGHLLYYFIELVKGSPLSDAVQSFGQRLGVVLLVMLMGLALFNDFMRLLGE